MYKRLRAYWEFVGLHIKQTTCIGLYPNAYIDFAWGLEPISNSLFNSTRYINQKIIYGMQNINNGCYFSENWWIKGVHRTDCLLRIILCLSSMLCLLQQVNFAFFMCGRCKSFDTTLYKLFQVVLVETMDQRDLRICCLTRSTFFSKQCLLGILLIVCCLLH